MLSYCEQLLLSRDKAEFVGYPTAYFASEEDVIIWFDIFSNNQHITASLEFEWWSETFKNAIRSFGPTVMVLAPWNDPLPLLRGWCIWELYCTIEGEKIWWKVKVSCQEVSNSSRQAVDAGVSVGLPRGIRMHQDLHQATLVCIAKGLGSAWLIVFKEKLFIRWNYSPSNQWFLSIQKISRASHLYSVSAASFNEVLRS